MIAGKEILEEWLFACNSCSARITLAQNKKRG